MEKELKIQKVGLFKEISNINYIRYQRYEVSTLKPIINFIEIIFIIYMKIFMKIFVLFNLSVWPGYDPEVKSMVVLIWMTLST